VKNGEREKVMKVEGKVIKWFENSDVTHNSLVLLVQKIQNGGAYEAYTVHKVKVLYVCMKGRERKGK